MSRDYYPGIPAVEGFYCRICKWCGETYYAEKVHPFEATHYPWMCDKRPKEKEVSESCEFCGEKIGPYVSTSSSGRCNGRCDGLEPVQAVVALTSTQTEALRTVNAMATSYLLDVSTGVDDGMYEAEDNDIDGMDDAINTVDKLIEDINSGKVRLVNLQE